MLYRYFTPACWNVLSDFAEYEKAIPAAFLFNACHLPMAGVMEKTERYFISNIKISKD